MLRRAAFSGLGSSGDADYVLTNRLLGVAATLLVLGTIGAVRRLGGRLGRLAHVSGWIAVAGSLMLAGGSLGEFVLFSHDARGLAAAGWFWFLMGLGVTAIGLTGVGARLWSRSVGWHQLVAGWLAASLPLMVAGWLLGLLGTTLALGVMGLCALLLRERLPSAPA